VLVFVVELCGDGGSTEGGADVGAGEGGERFEDPYPRTTISSESSVSAPLSMSVVDVRMGMGKGMCKGAVLIVPFPPTDRY
jgi:hypothetical protein